MLRRESDFVKTMNEFQLEREKLLEGIEEDRKKLRNMGLEKFYIDNGSPIEYEERDEEYFIYKCITGEEIKWKK